MAAPRDDETRFMARAEVEMRTMDSVVLADGRIASIADGFYSARVTIFNPATNTVDTEFDLRASEDLRGVPFNSGHVVNTVSIAVVDDGGFAVAIQSMNAVFMQYFAADGSARGPAFQARPFGEDNPLDEGWIQHDRGGITLDEAAGGVVLSFRQTAAGDNPERPGLVARFFDNSGNLQSEHVLHTNVGRLPQVLAMPDDTTLVIWGATRDEVTRPAEEQRPPGIYFQRFAADGQIIGTLGTIENSGDLQVPLWWNEVPMKVLALPEGGFKLLYVTGSNPIQNSTIDTGTWSLRMVDLDAALQIAGDPVTLIRFDDAPAGDGRWRMERFDAMLDDLGGITLALETDIMELPGQSNTGSDVFVAGFDLDGSLRSAPVQASVTAADFQGHPTLLELADGTPYLTFVQRVWAGPNRFNRELKGVSIDPEEIIDPIMAVELGLQLPEGISREAVLVTFTSDDGATEFTAIATEDGGFRFEIDSSQAQGLSGRIEVSKPYSPGTGDPVITAGDALEVLRMAVGLAPSFGTADVLQMIAADINDDGVVDAQDALEILRAAVGLATTAPPAWVFLDVDLDVSHITPQNVAYQTGIAVPDFSALGPLDMTGVLLGHMALPT